MRASSDLGLMVPEVRLFHDARKMKRFVRRKLKTKCKVLDSSGQMFYCDGVAVILMRWEGEPSKEFSLLAHEAYHAAVAHMGYLGEDEPGEEVMAYLVQTITHALIEAQMRWKAKRGHAMRYNA